MTKRLFDISYAFDHKVDGVTICPGVNPDLVDFIEGKQIEVHRPDGVKHLAQVVAISPLCQHPDDSLALCITGVDISQVPIGSQVFLVDLQ